MASGDGMLFHSWPRGFALGGSVFYSISHENHRTMMGIEAVVFSPTTLATCGRIVG